MNTEAKQEEKVMMECPGSKGCGITACFHHEEHRLSDYCQGGCFECSGCVPNKEVKDATQSAK